MKTIKGFEYLTPTKIEEAASLVAKYKREASVIAGGTDLVAMMKDKVVTPRYLIDIRRISGLDYIRYDEGQGLRIGALTSIATIERASIVKEKYVALHEATQWFGTTQVRNMATIGGNICRSAPSADTAPPLLVFDSVVKLCGAKGERTIPLEDFLTGPGENALKDEILTEIKVPAPKGPCQTGFKKLARSAEDLAKANCAVRIVVTDGKCEDIAIALGAVAPTPIRARRVEEIFKGKTIDDDIIGEASERVFEDIAPITDVRSDVEYRTYICKILIKRLVTRLMEGGV